MKVTLLGDSIREQYGPKVVELLGDAFEVWAPQENCRFAQYTLRGLFAWAAKLEDSEIVHWNNGHWDVCNLFGDGTFSDEEDYVKCMLRIADILLKRHRVVIFATTTPVRSENMYTNNEDIDGFNRRLVPLLQERGVIINDLNGLLRTDVDRYIRDDALHLSEEGISLCAEQVAAYIREAAKNIACVSENGDPHRSGDFQERIGAPSLL